MVDPKKIQKLFFPCHKHICYLYIYISIYLLILVLYFNENNPELYKTQRWRETLVDLAA